MCGVCIDLSLNLNNRQRFWVPVLVPKQYEENITTNLLFDFFGGFPHLQESDLFSAPGFSTWAFFPAMIAPYSEDLHLGSAHLGVLGGSRCTEILQQRILWFHTRKQRAKTCGPSRCFFASPTLRILYLFGQQERKNCSFNENSPVFRSPPSFVPRRGTER